MNTHVKVPSDAAKDLDEVFNDSAVTKRLKELVPSQHAAASRMWRTAMETPHLSPKMKELVLLAVHASSSSLHSEQVKRYVKRARAAGASEQDVLDVFLAVVGLIAHPLYFSAPVLVDELRKGGGPDGDLPPLTPEFAKMKADFIKSRGFWNEAREPVARLLPDFIAAVSGLSIDSWSKGSLTKKEREFVCIAIDCSTTHSYEPGLRIHIRNARSAGATREELAEVIQLASLMALETYVMGAKALLGSEG